MNDLLLTDDRIVITSIESVWTVTPGTGHKFSTGCRPTYALSFCEAGNLVYQHNGKEYVSDANHAIILPQGEAYSLYTDAPGRFPIINFSCANRFTDEFISIKLKSSQSYISDYEDLRKTFVLENNKIKSMGLLYLMLNKLASEKRSSMSPVSSIVSFMNENYADPSLTNEVLAQQLLMSEVYFRRCFKNSYGISPHKFLRNLRITKAKEYLSADVLSVAEIAEKCGFSSVYIFSRAFKTVTGMAPTEFRKSALLMEC